MDKFLNEQLIGQIQEVFKQLSDPVQVLLFSSQDNCQYCSDTRQLLSEVVALSGKLSLEEYDLDEHPEVARQYNVDKTPTLVFLGNDGDAIHDFGVRLAGIPSGYEFSTLINDLVLVSGRKSRLDDTTRKFLGDLKKPLLLQVFVTPT